jgi:hypothetical protein
VRADYWRYIPITLIDRVVSVMAGLRQSTFTIAVEPHEGHGLESAASGNPTPITFPNELFCAASPHCLSDGGLLQRQ